MKKMNSKKHQTSKAGTVMTHQLFRIVFQGSEWSCNLVSQDTWNGKSCKPSDLHSHEPIGITPRSQKSIYLGTTASTTMRGQCSESCASHPIGRSHNRAGYSCKFIRSATIAGGFFFQVSASLFKHKFFFCFVSEQNIASPHGNNENF